MTIISVVECGGRGGVHRSWTDFPMAVTYNGFEPDDREYKRLQDCIENRSNENLTYRLWNYAVGAETGLRPFFIYHHGPACSFYELDSSQAYRYDTYELKDTTELKTIKLDDFASRNDLAIDYLTIDCEGATLDILKGATQALQISIKGVRCEFELQTVRKGAPRLDELLAFMWREAGFRLVRLETCNAGLYGVTTDMNGYSISPMDGLPVTGDAIFVNDSLIERLISSTDEKKNCESLAGHTIFCILHGCGYYGAELMARLVDDENWRTFLSDNDSSRPLLECLAVYLGIPRININRELDGDKCFVELTGMERAAIQDTVDRTLFEKIINVYDENSLVRRYLDPSQV